MKTILLLASLSLGMTTVNAAMLVPNVEFSYDDGRAESGIGAAPTDQIIWLNAFQATAALHVLGVSIAFGPNPGDGAPVDVYLWSDPNNDGNPVDAVLERTISGVYFDANYSSVPPLMFADFNLTPREFLAGEFFFVGFQSAGYALVDNSSTAGHSFIFSNYSSSLMDPNNLGGAVDGGNIDDLGFPGNLTIRAFASIPEPSTYLAGISALGLLSLVLLRTRRKSTVAV